jgi:hypothetical protein
MTDEYNDQFEIYWEICDQCCDVCEDHINCPYIDDLINDIK